MSKNKVTWLCDWRLDNPEEQNGGSTEGRDNGRRMVDVPESGAGGHDRFDQQNPPKAPIQANSHVSYFNGTFMSHEKGGNGRGAYGGLAAGVR